MSLHQALICREVPHLLTWCGLSFSYAGKWPLTGRPLGVGKPESPPVGEGPKLTQTPFLEAFPGPSSGRGRWAAAVISHLSACEPLRQSPARCAASDGQTLGNLGRQWGHIVPLGQLCDSRTKAKGFWRHRRILEHAGAGHRKWC